MRPLNRLFPAARRLQLAVFLVSVIILYSISTQHLSVVDLPKFYLSFFVFFIFNQQPKLRLNIDWCISLLLITCIAIAASLLSKHQTLSFGRLVIYRDLFLFSFSTYLILRSELIRLSNVILLSIVCAFLLVAPHTLAEYFDFSKAVGADEVRYIDPKLSYYGHIRHFSYHAFIASCCAAILYLNSPKYRAATGVVCLVCVSMLVASTGRAAILAFLIFISLCSFRLYDLRQAIKIGAIGLFLVVALLLILSFTPYSSLTTSIVERTAHISKLNQIFSGRISFWQGGLISVFETPILGLGPNGFSWSEGAIPETAQPHSSLIQLIIEYGWLGGGIILYRSWLFFAPMCRNLKHDTSSNKYRLCLALFFLVYLLYSLVDGLFYHVLPMLHLALLVPILFASTKQQFADREA